jgi:anti-sigma factor RsiW
MQAARTHALSTGLPEAQFVKISCMEVIRELSSYIESDLNDQLRLQISEHLAGCAHCTAIYDGTRNVIRLVGDGRSFELPAGFSERLRKRIAQIEL